MSKNIRTLYLYIVSFIALSMIVGGIVSTVTAVASYNYPQVYYYYSDTKYNYDYNEYDNKDYYSNSTTQTQENYNQELLKRITTKKREHLRGIFSSVAVVIVGTPLFMYHWGKVEQQAKKEGVN